MRFPVLPLLALLNALLAQKTCWGLKIAAFNVQAFGPTKMGKADIVNTLSKIVQRNDITFLQEIRDPSGQNVIHPFLEIINRNPDNHLYSVALSDNVGRSTYKENYAYIYRNNTVDMMETHQYTDPLDKFEREPFSVKFRSKSPAQHSVSEFFLLGVHIRPNDVCSELDALEEAYINASNHFDNTSGIMLGDFNADCSYLSGCSFHEVSIVSSPKFSWLIDCSVDTTVKASHCAYDRIVAEKGINDCIVPESVKVFRFDLEYNLTQAEAEGVSDHYPVEFELNSECSCIESLRLLVFSSTHRHALSRGPHDIEVTVQGQRSLYHITSESFWSSANNELELNLRSDFGLTECVRKGDIEGVSIVPASHDGWNVKTVVTYVCEHDNYCHLLTQDFDIYYWVDLDGTENGEPLVLSLV